MLTKRFFRFGYQTPGEAERNAEHGWDDESSSGLWIMSASDEEAITWGCVIAEQFASSLFERAGLSDYSWPKAGFAHWIENNPIELEAAAGSPVVNVGETVDLASLSNDA